MLSTAYLLAMSLLAGILTGIIGMASLTLYPVLLSVGIPAITANATVTVATVGAGVGTVASSLRELRGHWRAAITIAGLSTIGSSLGAVILTHSSNAGFKRLVPLFILLAGILLLVPSGKRTRSVNSRLTIMVSWLSIFLIGLYNGYFGAASGLLMVAVLSKVIGGDYAGYNAIRNFSSFINNTCSAAIFIQTLRIQWSVIIPLLIGLFVGGYLGPIVVRYIPSTLIKNTVGVAALILALLLGYLAYC